MAAWLPIALQIAGTVISAKGHAQAGEEARMVAENNAYLSNLEARQLRYQAKLEKARSQRSAIEKRRESRLNISRALAVAGSSGAGVSDPTVLENIARLEGIGEYNALNALYEGDMVARQLNIEADFKKYGESFSRYQGRRAQRNADQRALSTLITGGASIYDTYNKYSKQDERTS